MAGTVRPQRPSREPAWGLRWRGSQTRRETAASGRRKSTPGTRGTLERGHVSVMLKHSCASMQSLAVATRESPALAS